jgi:3-oxoacyl-(acyl-carrier-protein) synthase
MTGHLLGAAGAIEAIISIKSIEKILFRRQLIIDEVELY